MKIEVFGTGCARCYQLEQHVNQALKESGIAAEVVYVSDIAAILSQGIIFTPALAIDGETKVSGRVPRVKELSEIFAEGGMH